ncbi:MAG: trypsin-like peptidase domain-containing protein [Giesbergeria sp.]
MISFVKQCNKKMWGGILLSALLVGCGGGSGGDVSIVTRVESRVQPADAVQEPSSVKSAPVSERVRPSIIKLESVPQSKEIASAVGGARMVGYSRKVAQTESAQALSAHLNWEPTPLGGWKSAIGFELKDAFGVRIGLHVKILPGEAILRVYSPEQPENIYQTSGAQILQRIQANINAGDMTADARTWWTPEIGQSTVVIELELPKGVEPKSLELSVPYVSHIFENIALPTEQDIQFAKIGESAACQLDSTCYDEHASKRNAVARMIFTKGGSTYVCSGTLLNDNKGSGTPYFLSANHCVSDQTVASTLQTDWFYRSPTCNNLTLAGSAVRRYNGATLLYATTDTDTSFMRLSDSPPAGVTFAGWDASAQSSGASLVGVHHPRGDLQKISFGKLQGFTSCVPGEGSNFSCYGTTGKFYTVNWTQGTTEGGSSGSAIWKDGYVIGTLYGGGASCTTTNAVDIYGRFDIAYAAKIKDWLSSSSQVSERSAVYRFYNFATGAHFYTMSSTERDYVIATYKNYHYEGAAFYAYSSQVASQSPVFRFYNFATGAHFYTINAAERDYVISTQSSYYYEGPRWYAQTGAGLGSIPVYRFYNTRTGAHFYTTNEVERDYVIATNKDFMYEGAAYYAWASQ